MIKLNIHITSSRTKIIYQLLGKYMLKKCIINKKNYVYIDYKSWSYKNIQLYGEIMDVFNVYYLFLVSAEQSTMNSYNNDYLAMHELCLHTIFNLCRL